MNSFIYLRGLKHAEHSVFCVSEGQKKYYDNQFERYLPYSSGQQVKRTIIELMTEKAGEKLSKTTFYFKKEKLAEEEVHGTCDPRDVDQLLGGWLKIIKDGKERSIKRRSPLSISAMRPLHPTLAGINKEMISFDRTNTANINKIVVRDSKGNSLNDEEIEELLDGTARSVNRKWIPEDKNTRATGLFVYDVAVDLRRLFSISLNKLEPEVNEDIIESLKAARWIESENIFGKCLNAPIEFREKVIPAIAHALLNWRITSNQSRTFSFMETLAISISENANKIPAAIRAKLTDDTEKLKAIPIVEEIDGVDLFITLPCAGYIVTTNERVDALEKAEGKLKEMLLKYPYENQLKTVE